MSGQEEDRVLYFETLWFTNSSGVIKVDSAIIEIKPNTVYCLAPGQMRSYCFDQNPEGYRIAFSADFFFLGAAQTRMASWLDQYGAGNNIPIIEADDEMQMEITAIVKRMQKEYFNYYLLRAEILSGLLNILIIHLSRRLQAPVAEPVLSKDNELVRNFKRLLKKHIINKKQVADYAGELYVTPNYLNKVVKKLTGFTASYHIQQQIILEAKRQAIQSNRSMKEIAYCLGFDNLAHFSKFFKNNSGMNFTSYKRELTVGQLK